MAQRELPRVENGRKGLGGKLRALQDPGIFASKIAEEERFRDGVDSDAGLRLSVGDAWDAIAEAQRAYLEFFDEHTLRERSPMGGSELFGIARQIVRLVEERAKPDSERLDGYQESRIATLELGLFSSAPIHEALEINRIESGLALMAERFGGESPEVRQALSGKSPAERARELVEGTSLGDVAARRRLVEGGRDAVMASRDPMIRAALATDAAARAVRKRYEDEVQAVERGAYERLASARFQVFGEDVYPDATFSLRLAIGTVKGFEQEGTWVDPFTEFGGLYERFEERGPEEPFALPPRWVEARSRVDLSTPYNFVSTNDIIGGNSGSPIVNRDGRVVGLIFDGNRYSFVWDTIFSGEQGRAVSVDARGILEALRVVYGAEGLVKELTAETR